MYATSTSKTAYTKVECARDGGRVRQIGGEQHVSAVCVHVVRERRHARHARDEPRERLERQMVHVHCAQVHRVHVHIRSNLMSKYCTRAQHRYV